MANLPETGAWPAGVYQIEATDPVLGGAPNIATGAGMSNIPHQQLAQRTRVLKDILDTAGVGATAVPLVTLNSAAARVTGSYRFASGDANTPATGIAGTVQVIAASASAVNQLAMDSASTRMWMRFWNGTVWSAWSEIWRTTGASENLGVSGWQRLPSGLILQWVNGMSDTNSVMTLTFPVAFPTALLGGVANEANPSGWAANSVTSWGFDIFSSTLTTGIARVRNVIGTSGPSLGVGISGRILAWGKMMASFFDPVTAAFFDDTLHSVIPPGAVPVTLTRKVELFAGQEAGAQIVAGPDGAPLLEYPSAPSAADLLAGLRASTRVSAFQAKAALYNRGLLDDAEAVAVAAGGLTLLAWQTATSFERLSPAITALAPAIGITTPEDLDELFVEAALISA